MDVREIVLTEARRLWEAIKANPYQHRALTREELHVFSLYQSEFNADDGGLAAWVCHRAIMPPGPLPGGGAGQEVLVTRKPEFLVTRKPAFRMGRRPELWTGRKPEFWMEWKPEFWVEWKPEFWMEWKPRLEVDNKGEE